jgi:hypothetical protein
VIVENVADLGYAVGLIRREALGHCDLGLRQTVRTPTFLPARSCGSQSRLGPLSNEITLKLGERTKEVKDEFDSTCCGILPESRKSGRSM